MPPRRRAGRGSDGERGGDSRVEGERDSATDSTDGNNNNNEDNGAAVLSSAAAAPTAAAAATTSHDAQPRGRGEGHGRPAERVADGASSSSPVAGLVALAGFGRLGSSPSSGQALPPGGHERRGGDSGGASGGRRRPPSAPRGPDQRNVVGGVPVIKPEGDSARAADTPAQHEEDPVQLTAEGRPSAKRAKPKSTATPPTAAGRAKSARSDALASPKQIQLGAPAALSLQQGKGGRLPAPHPLRYGAAARGTLGGAKAEPPSAPSPLANFGRPSSHFAPAGTATPTATPPAGGRSGYVAAGMGTPERRPVPQIATNSPAAAAGVVPGMTGVSRSASTSPSKSFAQRHEARLRGTGSPRIGFQDKALSRRSSLQEEEDDDDDHLWTRYIDRDEPRFYISQMASRAMPLNSPPKLGRHVSRTGVAEPSALGTMARAWGSGHAEDFPSPSNATAGGNHSGAGSPSTARAIGIGSTLRRVTSKGFMSSVVAKAAGTAGPAGSTSVAAQQAGAMRAPPPLNVHIPSASGRNTPDEFSPLPSPLMSPTVIRAAQALAILPEAARMSPLRSPLASLYGLGRGSHYYSAAGDSLDAYDSEEDALSRSLGSYGRNSRGVSRRSSYTRTSHEELPCRSCGTIDDYDMLRCYQCGTCFHMGCESPPLEWIPTKAFCSSTCFSRYKSSEEGRRLFAEFVLLSTGYLRRLDNCVEPEALPAPKEVPIRGRLQECKIEVPDVPVKIGDVVSLRAKPTLEDPRSEWPAIVRRVVFMRSGEPALFVNWLLPQGRDTYFDGDADDPSASAPPLVTEETSESQDSEDETLSTGSSQTQSTTNARGESTVILPNGKKGIRCTCGRIFSSGQALGGHRGKCKVPRERQRDREARGRASTAGVPYEPPTPEPRTKRAKTVRRRARGDNDGSAKGAETGAGGVKYPRMELLRASDYKIGPAEPLAQSLASVVKIHVGVHFPMPAEALTHEKRKAIERFSYDCIDENVNSVTLHGKPFHLHPGRGVAYLRCKIKERRDRRESTSGNSRRRGRPPGSGKRSKDKADENARSSSRSRQPTSKALEAY